MPLTEPEPEAGGISRGRLIGALAGAVSVFVLVATVYWKLALFPLRYIWFDHWDMCQLEIPRLVFLAHSIHGGHFPSWDPHVWSGLPTLGSAQPGFAYPLNLLWAALPVDRFVLPVATLNWLFMAIHFAGAMSLYALCRSHGLRRIPSLLGAVSFSCGGFFGSIPWIDVGNGVSLTPLIFLFAFRLWTPPPRALDATLLGVTLGLSWLSGHHEIPLIDSYAVLFGGLAVTVYRSAAARRPDLRVSAATAWAFVLAAAISAVQTLPMYEFGRLSKRWVGVAEPIGWGERVPYAVDAQYSLPWSGIAGALVPNATPRFGTVAFFGITIVVLGVCGLVCRWRVPAVRMAACLGMGGLVLALGAATPVHRLLYEYLPLLDKARNPVRALFLAGFAISVLAAYGAEEFLARDERRRRKSLILGIIAAATLTFVASSLLAGQVAFGSPEMLRGVVPGAVLVTLALWKRPGNRISGAALLILVMVELTPVTNARITELGKHNICATALVSSGGVSEWLSTEPAGRITVNDQDLMTDVADLQGLDQLGSFTAAVPVNILRHELHTPRTQALFGVTHHIGRTAASGRDVLAREFPGGLRAYRKREANPRAWILHRTMQVTTESELRRLIQDAAFDSMDTAAMLQSAVPDLEQCDGAESVRVTRPDTDTVVLDASLNCRGLIVLSDEFYPGWQGALDGAPARLYEAFGSFRAVVVPRGTHRIDMRYSPASVRCGMILTVTAWWGSAGLVAWLRRPHAATSNPLDRC